MAFTLEPLGEAALLVRFGMHVESDANARVHALAHAVTRQRPPWLLDVVPAYATLALFFDPDAFAANADPMREVGDWVCSVDPAEPRSGAVGRLLEIPVHYGGADGPDLDEVARHAGLSTSQVIAAHGAAEYRVAMLGFAPGFPYLLGLDPRLATPRLDNPRTRVPAGSVGIGGDQSGIYPMAGPGGWRLIGRTDAVLFDPLRAAPALLAPGDRVRFVAVTPK